MVSVSVYKEAICCLLVSLATCICPLKLALICNNPQTNFEHVQELSVSSCRYVLICVDAGALTMAMADTVLPPSRFKWMLQLTAYKTLSLLTALITTDFAYIVTDF